MAPRKRQLTTLHQRTHHPLDAAYPFEAVRKGSWQAVEFLKIMPGGKFNVHLIDTLIMHRKILFHIRLKSRQATPSDCSTFLRPGIDITTLTAFQLNIYNNKSDHLPMWVDARISSIQRQPHENGECHCQFYVNLYDDQGELGLDLKTLNKDVIKIGLHQIFILQRLSDNTLETLNEAKDTVDVKPYRWDSSQDCSSLSQSRLLLGKFYTDFSFLTIISTVMNVSLKLRIVQRKLVYEVIGNDTDICFPNVINVLSLKIQEGRLVPHFCQINEFCDFDEAEEAEEKEQMSVEPAGLRRSGRKIIKPDRYLGCNDTKLEVGFIRTCPYKRGGYVVEDENSHSSDSDSDSDEKVDDSVPLRQYRKKKTKDDSVLNLKPCNEAKESCDEEVDDTVTLRHYYRYCREKIKRKKTHQEFDYMDVETKWVGIHFKKGVQTKRHCSIFSTNVREGGGRTRMNADACKEIIDTYMMNMNSLPTEEEKILDEQETNKLEQMEEEKEDPENLEDLWEELNTSLTSSYLLHGGNEVPAETKEICEHNYKLDEEIGIYCLRCGFVKTEIRYISETIIENPKWKNEEKQCSEEHEEAEESEAKVDEEKSKSKAKVQKSKSEAKVDEADKNDVFSVHAGNKPKIDENEPVTKENENVWELIPELKEKMHEHQEKAFEFLWRNIAGSMKPSLMKENSKKIGGCVISHTPGAGKTFLIITFLTSYLKLFPWKRPLILAPKTTLYTWRKEFKKWNFPLPVYMVHGRRTRRGSGSTTVSKPLTIPGVPKPPKDAQHVLDCLSKIQKWNEHASVLVMGYTSFLALMREETKFAHRKYMAKTLKDTPGLLILDEGHNPRSTKSRLRKSLMKLPTELRILLSGTMFQNNLCEYFNSLCLARPKFVAEVLKELDPKFRKKGGKVLKARHLLESRSRKFFLDNIAKKINSDNDEERMEGLYLLRKLTNGFIDAYDSGNGNSSETLPGLQIYTLLMNTADEQSDIVKKLHKKMDEYPGYPLEIELLITLGSIHPWLIKSASACAEKFFTEEELKKLEETKFDLKKASKVRFVLSLISRVVKKEKVIVFCHNLAPVKFLIELFQKYFQWQKGKEILLLTGDLDLFERGKVIDKFENPHGSSRILLASINACGEGISLTAASRVIFLDSEWNPSKTKQAIARAFRPGQQKMVYVYQLLLKGSMEEFKYRRTTWKEWVSCLIFSQDFVEDPSKWIAEKIEDDVLREMVEEDQSKAIHMIMKNEKASTT